MSDKKTFSPGPDRIKIHVPKDLNIKPYVSYYDESGKIQRKYKGLTKPTSHAGRVAAAKLLMQEIIENYVPTRSLEAMAWDWIESRKPHLRQKSYYGYNSKLRLFLRWKGDRPISKQLVSEYFAFRAETVSGGTLKDDQIYLRRCFDSISDERFFDHLDLPKFQAETKEHFQPSQIKMIRAHLIEEDPMLWFACQCVYYLFLRPSSELRVLKVHHFDLSRKVVKVPPAISKTKRLEFIRIPSVFLPDIKDYVASKMPNDYLFPAVFDSGKPIGKNTMMYRHRRHMDRLGFGAGYSLYSWKNTGAISLVNNGVNPKKLSLQMRHSSLEMTDRYLKRMGVVDIDDEDLNFNVI